MKPRLALLVVGIAVGYVLGARDGRARYDQLKAKAVALWEDPRVTKARHDVEAYAREQAPIIRERAEAAAKAAPGVAKDAATKAAATAKDVSAKATATAKNVSAKAATTAKDVVGRVNEAAADVREQAGKVAGNLRERGEAAVDKAVTTAGEARDAALDVLDNEDDTPTKA
jgi:uncharacterized protein YjbJ (UPF0337 family)